VSNDEWEKGLEIPLMSMDEQGALSMKSTQLDEMLSTPGDKLLYVYDFVRMWIFYVELLEVKKDKPSTIYPRVAMAFGDAPSQDSREMDFGEDTLMLGALEGLELDGAEEEEEEDEFGSGEEFFDESEFDGQFRDEE
ncbi:MAG: IS1096 element passenger TnpR family protein, partial [Flavobacteriales bacterium]